MVWRPALSTEQTSSNVIEFAPEAELTHQASHEAPDATQLYLKGIGHSPLLNADEEKHQEVIARRFGPRGNDRATLEEVGSEIGLTRERVRQIQVEGLSRLRRSLEDHGLSPDQLF
jgi:DNA-directed RNA polymerase sigma subunit (sigma70/sigma32)